MLELMERAGGGLAELVAEIAPYDPVVVVCGKGNNGGDGYVAARRLRAGRARGARAATAPPEELEGDAAANARRLEGPAPEPFSAGALEGAAVAVDALLGTGFDGRAARRGGRGDRGARARGTAPSSPPTSPAASTPRPARSRARPCTPSPPRRSPPPSRACGSSPATPTPARCASSTSASRAGAPVDPPDVGLIDDDALLALVPRRQAGWTKFTSGHVLVAGGSRGLTGAPCLAAEAAMRAGAGYVTACVPALAGDDLRAAPARGDDARAARRGRRAHRGRRRDRARAERARRRARRRAGARAHRRRRRLRRAASCARRRSASCSTPTASTPTPARSTRSPARGAPTVLTPHAGELGRLLGVDSDEVHARRLHHARAAAAGAQAIVVLKGDDTLVAEPDGLRRRQPRRDARAGHRRHRRRAQRRDRRAAGARRRAVRRRLRRRAPARARRASARPGRAAPTASSRATSSRPCRTPGER